MWEQITTISEIDTVDNGSLVAKENPDEHTETIIYRVAGKHNDYVTLNPESDSMTESTTLRSDALFDDAWWMFKKN